mmetsp:Transcript_22627/g.48849  ORF Transcript_22627/g.48849 Transcript_22627/m.48849 type:complete len:140 (-) Transcript_22627:374-793(-)
MRRRTEGTRVPGASERSMTGTTETNEVERQVNELHNQIHHLARSNAELEQHLREHGHDAELRAAIGENIVAIAKRRAIMEDLQKLLPAWEATGHAHAGEEQGGSQVEACMPSETVDGDVQMENPSGSVAAAGASAGVFL